MAILPALVYLSLWGLLLPASYSCLGLLRCPWDFFTCVNYFLSISTLCTFMRFLWRLVKRIIAFIEVNFPKPLEFLAQL